MRAKIKGIYSLEIEDLPTYKPPDPESFCIPIRIIAGPEHQEGEESFDVQVCSPKWMLENYRREDVIIGRHFLIAMEYDYNRIAQRISSFGSNCEGANWGEVAEKLSRLGQWEFEDYQEAKNS